jgi:EmrB/QacA subfamily drug resistance transporter
MTPGSRAISFTVGAALFMENMDASIIATSLPAIATDLGTDPVSLKLAFTTYLLSLTVFLPISGWLADRYGAKHVFRLAIVIFTVASVLCGFAASLEGLVAARALQGLGGALMVPVGRIILLRAVPKSELVDALALLALPALVGPLLGPPIGGFITTYFDWRWVFWMNVPPGLLGLALATWLMPETRIEGVPAFDGRGFLLAGIGLSFTVFGLTIAGRDLMRTGMVWVLVGLGVVALALYYRHARRVTAPVLDLNLFRIKTFSAGVIGGSFYRVGVGAFPFVMALMLQLGFGLTPFQSGVITCSSALGALIMKVGAATIIRRLGFRTLLIWNGLASCLLMAVNSIFTASTPALLISGILLVAAFLRSLQFTAMNAMSYADVEHDDMSRATSLYSVIQQLALAAGVSCAALVLDVSLWWRGSAVLATADFAVTFLVVAAVSAFSVLPFWHLQPGAGESVSGRR